MIVKFFKKYGIIHLNYTSDKYFHIIFNGKKFPDYYKLKYDFSNVTEIHWHFIERNPEYILLGMNEYKELNRITDIDDITMFVEIQQELKSMGDIHDYIFWLTKHGRIKKRSRYTN